MTQLGREIMGEKSNVFRGHFSLSLPRLSFLERQSYNSHTFIFDRLKTNAGASVAGC